MLVLMGCCRNYPLIERFPCSIVMTPLCSLYGHLSVVFQNNIIKVASIMVFVKHQNVGSSPEFIPISVISLTKKNISKKKTNFNSNQEPEDMPITNVLLDRNGEGPIYPVKGPLKAHSGCPYRDSTSVSSHPPPPQPYPGHAGTVSAVVLQVEPKIRLFMGNHFSRISTLCWFIAWDSKRTIQHISYNLGLPMDAINT